MLAHFALHFAHLAHAHPIRGYVGHTLDPIRGYLARWFPIRGY